MDVGGFGALIVSLRCLLLNKLDIVALGPRRTIHDGPSQQWWLPKVGGNGRSPGIKEQSHLPDRGGSISDPGVSHS